MGPQRFLKDGKVHKPSHFMPFGSGQRMCLGDKLAEMELQLFFSSLMHVFDIELTTQMQDVASNLTTNLKCKVNYPPNASLSSCGILRKKILVSRALFCCGYRISGNSRRLTQSEFVNF